MRKPMKWGLITLFVFMISNFIGGCIENLLLGEAIFSQIFKLERQITPILIGLIGGFLGYFYGKRIEDNEVNTRKNVSTAKTSHKQIDMGIHENIGENRTIESETKYQTLVENMKEGVLLENTEGIITFVNPGLCEMLGYEEHELLGNHWEIITPPREIDKVTKETLKRADGISSAYETIIITKDGQNIPIINTSTPIVSETGILQGILSLMINITEQKKFQKLQERFIGTTSHELRTPVTVIKGYIDFLRKYPNQPLDKSIQIYKKLHSNINRLSKLIDNVHSLSKIYHDVLVVSRSQITLDEFVTTVQDQISVLYPKKTIVVYQFTTSKNSKIIIDEDLVLQALHNLISNAVKNSPNKSVVEISIFLDNSLHELQISVQDFGAGISLVNFFQLFQPFSHLDTKYTSKGTGLGLYIVKNLVMAHSGKIEIFSQENFGTNFTITIPTI